MSSWHSYPKIFQLGHPQIKELFQDSIIVQEKIDGSQFSFGLFEDGLKCRSKGKEIFLDNPEKMFNKAIETVINLKDKLTLGWTYRGEFLQKEHHNTLKYSRIPKQNIIIFDINSDNENYMQWQAVQEECKRLDLECVDTFYEGKIENGKEVFNLLEKESKLGGSKIEGLVFKNYLKFGADKKCLMGKYVSEDFKEIHNEEWKKKNPTNKDILEVLIIELKTEARWNKSIQHLKELDKIEFSPKDIGSLIKEIQDDLKLECKDYIKDKLYIYAIDKILRGCIAGFPEYYKKYLLEKQFEK
jgi:hypothetical protein